MVRHLQYNLSAMLSAFQCVLNYMKAECEASNADSLKWYGRLKRRKIIEAFSALRHSDVHDETIGTAYQTTIGETRSSAIVLNAEELGATEHLGKRPRVVKLLSSRPIIELATDAYGELAQAVRDGYEQRRFASLPPLPEPTKVQQLSGNPPRSLDEYLNAGAINRDTHNHLCSAVSRRRIIEICGDSGSGKSAMLRALLREYCSKADVGGRVVAVGVEDARLTAEFSNLVVVPQMQANNAGIIGTVESVFVDDVNEQSILEALRAWQRGASGAFVRTPGDVTPVGAELNAVAPIRIVMVQGAVGMFIERHDEAP